MILSFFDVPNYLISWELATRDGKHQNTDVNACKHHLPEIGLYLYVVAVSRWTLLTCQA